MVVKTGKSTGVTLIYMKSHTSKVRVFASGSAVIALLGGLLMQAPAHGAPAPTATVITSDEVDAFRTLWSKSGPFTPALSAGPEVGWNAGLQSMRPLGANYYRLWDMKVAWRDVNPAPGVFDFSILDQRVAQVESWGGKPIMVLGLTPQWAAADPSAGDPRWGAGTASPPADIESWRSYVRAIVQRYGGRIGAYEIWNEANLQTFWTGSPQQMADMVRVATDEIGGTSIKLAPSVTTRLRSGGDFTAALVSALPASVMAKLDAWSIHTYPSADAGPSVPQACEQRVDDIIGWQRKLIAASNGNFAYLKPVWDTEVNYGLAGPGARPRTVWSDADGAALLNCTYQDSRALGIAVTAWYEYTASDYDLLGVQMNPGTPQINGAWGALSSVVGQTNSWIPNLNSAVTKSITIVGSRGTVSGKSGIIVDAISTGLPEGTVLKPWFRFPGQTTFTEGTARIKIDANGEGTWSRKTGKKIYVYLTTLDETVKSNRVIIAAQ